MLLCNCCINYVRIISWIYELNDSIGTKHSSGVSSVLLHYIILHTLTVLNNTDILYYPLYLIVRGLIACLSVHDRTSVRHLTMNLTMVLLQNKGHFTLLLLFFFYIFRIYFCLCIAAY